jgi:hypothetical protein
MKKTILVVLMVLLVAVFTSRFWIFQLTKTSALEELQQSKCYFVLEDISLGNDVKTVIDWNFNLRLYADGCGNECEINLINKKVSRSDSAPMCFGLGLE